MYVVVERGARHHAKVMPHVLFLMYRFSILFLMYKFLVMS